MKRKLLFPFLAMLLLAPWPVAYAYDNVIDSPEPIQIEAAETSAAPSWTAFGGAIGGVATPADLFYVDTTTYPADTPVTLYITNAAELIQCYRYLILNVGVYVETGVDQWERLATGDGEVLPDTYITMHNSRTGFTLPGCARYKITIDGGSFYCFPAGADTGGTSPKFYLTAE